MDPKGSDGFSSDHLKTHTSDEKTVTSNTGECRSTVFSISKGLKGRVRHSATSSSKKVSAEEETSENEDGSGESKYRPGDDSQSETQSGSSYPPTSKAVGAVSGTVTSADGSVVKQAVKLQKMHLYSVSLPSSGDGKKQMTVPLKKKAPVIIRNISTMPVKKVDNEISDAGAAASYSIEAVQESESKTIIVPKSPIQEETKEGIHSSVDTFSEHSAVIGEEALDTSNSRCNSSQNEEVEKKSVAVHNASSSQASPYNTRFAHMKIGTIFPLGSRSSGISKRKINREISKPISETPTIRQEKSGVDDQEQFDSGVCFLCGIAFADDMGVSLSVKKPLPLSNVDLVSLLESFSISCSSIQTQNLNFVNICNVCHTLVIEGDSTYKHLLSVASEMREQWPYRALKKNPVFSLNLPENSFGNFDDHENLPKGRVASEENETAYSEPKRPRGRVGRPPKIRIKQEGDTDENWKPTQIKLERGTHTGRRGRPPKRKLKRERRGRPRKVVIKGEISEDEVYTCGLCGQSFLEENDWARHFEATHKTQLRWVNYRSQKKLKKLIMMDIQQGFLDVNFTENTCHACDVKLCGRDEYINHLRNLHKMVIDDEFITSLHNYSQGHVVNVNDLSAAESEREDFAPTDDEFNVSVKGEIVTPIEKVEKSAFKCRVCHLLLDSEKALKDHTDTSHFSLVVISGDDAREIVLPEGKPTGREANTLEEKISPPVVVDKENVDDTEFTCEECEEAFDSRHSLLEHKLNIHGSNDDKGQERGLVRYECEVCGRRIYGLAALRVHMTKVHYKTVSSFKHSCSMCVYKSQSRSQLGKHMRNKHGKEIMPSVQCETCGKMYGPSYIAKHIATMHSTHTRNYECNFCDMKFYDMAGLKFHIYHEHANKVWKCNKCPMEFKKYHQLRQHRIFTHSTKVHACLECPKTYKRKSDLTEHVKRLHLQRVVLLCPRCPKQYVNRFKLRNHLMKHHDVPWEDTLARNYARHQRANNCRRTEEGILEFNKDQPHAEESSVFIQESYDHFNRHGKAQESGDSFEGQAEDHEYHDHFNRNNEEHEYHAHYRQNNAHMQHSQDRSQQFATVKLEKEDEPEEYIEIIEAADAFAKDGITYVIIEET